MIFKVNEKERNNKTLYCFFITISNLLQKYDIHTVLYRKVAIYISKFRNVKNNSTQFYINYYKN